MSARTPQQTLAATAEAWYRRCWDRFPTVGSYVGLTEYDARLEAPDADLYRADLADAEKTLAAVEAIPAPGDGETAGDRLDRRELEAQLKLRILQNATIGNWKRNPADPADVLITSLFYLLMRRDLDRPETAEALAARLEKSGEFLRAARSRVTDPVALWVSVALDTAGGGAEFIRDVAPQVAARHPALKARLEKAAAAAGQALDDYAAWLRELRGRTLTANPAIGREAMAEVVRLNHGLTESLPQIKEYGLSQIADFKQRQARLSKEIDPTLTPAEIIQRENRRYAETEPDMLAEYRRITYDIRDRLVSEGILDLPPGESCEVISTPGFLRAMLPTAAYSSPGPLDRNQRGIFYVSDPPKSLPRDEYLSNVGMHFPLDATCAHEAYPGHHVQLCWANQAPSLIRKLADHIIFMEGWTLYCEQLMVELGWYPNKVFELSYLNDQLWRACRIVIDASLHAGEMTVDEAVAMLQKEVGFTAMRARTELNWYTQSPGTPMSYLLGKGKTLALREQYRTEHPGSSLKDFHNWLLKQGSIPQGWLTSRT